MQTIRSKKVWTDSFSIVQSGTDDLETLYEFYELGEAGEDEINLEYSKLQKQLEDLEFKRMLRNEEDQLSAMLEINPGAGGTALAATCRSAQ